MSLPQATLHPLASNTRIPPGLTPIGSVLPAIGITKRRLNKLDAIVQARHPEGRPRRAFSARPFVLCGIPIRRPLKRTLEYSRQNGKFHLRVIGHPDYGLPTVRADCTCAPLAFGMGRNISSLPPAAWSAI